MKRFVAMIVALVILTVSCSAVAETMAEKYQRAIELVAAGEYAQAGELLESFGSYEDSTRLALYCKAIVLAEKGAYDLAFVTFANLGENYRDCQFLISYYTARQYETNAETLVYLKGENWIKASNTYLKTPMFRDSMERAVNCLNATYQYAAECSALGYYSIAANCYELLEDYLDSKNRHQQAVADGLYETGKYIEAYKIYKDLADKYKTHADDYLAKYNAAIEQMTSGNYDNAITAFTEIENYSDASTYLKECKYQKALILASSAKYNDAIMLLNELGEYRDSSILAVQYAADQLYDEEKLAEAYEIYKNLAADYQTHQMDYEAMYIAAQEMLENGKYDEARNQFLSLGSYRNAADDAQNCLIRKAEYLFAGNLFDEAATIYASLNDEPNLLRCYYHKALMLASSAQYDDAIILLNELGEYRDSSILAVQYAADQLYDEKKLAEAYEIYKNLAADYQTHQMDYEAMYIAAQEMLENGKYDEARNQFLSLGSYRNAADDAQNCLIRKAEYLFAGNLFDEAATIYASLNDEPNLLRCYYHKAIMLAEQKKYTMAADVFRKCLSYQDARDQHYQMAAQAFADGCLEEAFSILKKDADYINTRELAYQIALEATDAENFELSIDAYSFSGKLQNAVINVQIDSYRWGKQLYEIGEYTRSAAVFKSLGNFSTAPEKVREAGYAEGNRLMKENQFASAEKYFVSLKDYKDSKSLLKECRYQIATENHEKELYHQALNLFQTSELKGYKDVKERIKDCYYHLGTEQEKNGAFESALEMYQNCIDYLDTPEHITACNYNLALAEIVKGNPDKAMTLFASTMEYADTKQQIYILGEYYQITEQYDRALAAFSMISDQEQAVQKIYEIMGKLGESDSSGAMGDMASAVHYLLGDTAMSRQDYSLAALEFEAAGRYKDAQTRAAKAHYDLAEAALTNHDTETALTEFEAAGNYSDAAKRIQKIHYDLAEAAYQNEKYDLAIAEYENAEGYEDSEEKILKAHYAKGLKALDGEDYDLALTIFYDLRDYEDSQEQILKVYYIQGLKALQSKEFDSAASFFELAVDYTDAKEMKNESLYQKMLSLMERSDYQNAYNTIIKIIGYKDTVDLLNTNESLILIMKLNFAKAGSIVAFGHYEQDNDTRNGAEPVLWTVLDVQGGKSLLISLYALDSKPYNTKQTKVTWEKSSIRKWLNSEFFNSAFSKQEQADIVMTNVDNSLSSDYYYNSKGSNNTKDRIFLLSFAEANRYLGVSYGAANFISIAKPTLYALSQGIKGADETVPWWLRSPGFDERYGTYVTTNGAFYSNYVDTHYAVRPAFWLNLEQTR